MIVYNFMAIRPDMLLQPAATLQVDKALEDLDIDKAKQLFVQNPAPTTSVIAAGLNRVDLNNYDPEPIKEAIEEGFQAALQV